MTKYKNIPNDHKKLQKEIIDFFGILSTKELQKILKFMIDLEANTGATDNEY